MDISRKERRKQVVLVEYQHGHLTLEQTILALHEAGIEYINLGELPVDLLVDGLEAPKLRDEILSLEESVLSLRHKEDI